MKSLFPLWNWILPLCCALLIAGCSSPTGPDPSSSSSSEALSSASVPSEAGISSEPSESQSSEESFEYLRVKDNCIQCQQFDFDLTLPAGWLILSEEEMAELMGIAQETVSQKMEEGDLASIPDIDPTKLPRQALCIENEAEQARLILQFLPYDASSDLLSLINTELIPYFEQLLSEISSPEEFSFGGGSYYRFAGKLAGEVSAELYQVCYLGTQSDQMIQLVGSAADPAVIDTLLEQAQPYLP